MLMSVVLPFQGIAFMDVDILFKIRHNSYGNPIRQSFKLNRYPSSCIEVLFKGESFIRLVRLSVTYNSLRQFRNVSIVLSISMITVRYELGRKAN